MAHPSETGQRIERGDRMHSEGKAGPHNDHRGQAGRMGDTKGEHSRRDTGAWTGCEWVPCADGTQRPVEPGAFPLADGVPGRVGLLRGYGNAIVPQQAAAFIEAYEEANPGPGADRYGY
jgi:DNA (cytosine-5)-methyltransferase 1